MIARILAVVAAAAVLVAAPTGAAVAQTASTSSEHPLGAMRPTGTKAPTIKRLSAAQTPASVDLTPWAVPVGDQGQIGSCVTWAINYGMEGWYANKAGVATSFAPMYVYSQIHVDDSSEGGGSYPSDAYSVASNQGVDSQFHYPQGNYDFTDLPTTAETANATAYKAGTGSILFEGTQGSAAESVIQTELAGGHPVAISLDVYSAFDDLYGSNSVLDASQVDTSTDRGGHEILVLGYDSTGVRVQNSWGTGWGDQGYATLTWAFVNQYVWEASAMTGLVNTPPTTPAAPATAAGTTSGTTATLTWQPPATVGASAITGYVVSRDGTDSKGNGAWSTTVGAAATSQSFTSLTPGSAYTLSVKAINGSGTGTAATAKVTVAGNSTVPGAPTSVAATASGTTATLTWAPPATTGGSAITGYTVSRDGTDSKGSGAWSTTVAAATRSQSFTSLVPGTTYHLSVAATNASGTGSAVSATVTVPSTATVPGAPTSVTGTTSGTTATISWSAPAGTGGSAITGYTIARDGSDTKGGGGWSTLDGPTVRSQSMTNLVPGATYHLAVAAVNAVGAGAIITVTVTVAAALSAPQSLTITGNSAKATATVTWAPPASTGGATITGYLVARTGTDAKGNGPYSTTVSASTRSFTFTSLKTATTYTITVQAITTAAGPAATGTVKL